MNKDDGRDELDILTKAAVIIRSIDPKTNKKIILLGKTKHPRLKENFLTLPAGCFDLKTETPINAAMRELKQKVLG
jgi:8-oxo-dGTP pyrophosphatase MutT (NUDIX family)